MSARTIPPHNSEAEISVLGACLQDLDAARKASELLGISDFFGQDHGEIFGVVQSLVTRGIPPDPVTVPEELNRRQRLEAVGGGLYLYDLVEKTPTGANVVAHARIVKEKSNCRRLIAACVDAAEKVHGGRELRDLKAEPVSFTVYSLLPKGMLSLLLSGKDKRGKTLLRKRCALSSPASTSSAASRPNAGQSCAPF
jgi:replicative DNA helicase